MKIRNIIITATLSLFIFSCAGKKSDISTLYKSGGNKLEAKEYLAENLEGTGILQNKDGVVIKKFFVKVTGSWENNKGVVKRQFSFEDGIKDSRTWLITMDNDNLVAVGHDIIGNATGKQHGEVLQVNYVLSMKIDGVKEKINIEEITHKIGNDSSISILSLKKGFTNKGQMIISLKKAIKGESERKVGLKAVTKNIEVKKDLGEEKKLVIKKLDSETKTAE